jgi:F-type H+-transporting ATPase subunit alpha
MQVVGGAGVGRTALCLDAVQAQAAQGLPCVWACLRGQGAAVAAALAARGCLHNTAVVAAAAGSPAAVQFATAAAALSVAEGFRNDGGKQPQQQHLNEEKQKEV